MGFGYNNISRMDLEVSFIIDLDTNKKSFSARNRYLSKNKVQYLNLPHVMYFDFFGDIKANYIYTLNMFSKIYKKIMIIGNGWEDRYNTLLFDKDNIIFYNSAEQLKWDIQERCFSCPEVDSGVEVVLSFNFSIKQSYLKIADRKVHLYSF